MEPWHLLLVARWARQVDKEEFEVYGEGDAQIWACRQCLKPGIAFTALQDTDPVACFGLVDEGRGMASAWMIATDKWKDSPRDSIRVGRMMFNDSGFRRIQALVRPDLPERAKFIASFGFEFEGKCRKIAPNGADMLLFSKIEV